MNVGARTTSPHDENFRWVLDPPEQLTGRGGKKLGANVSRGLIPAPPVRISLLPLHPGEGGREGASYCSAAPIRPGEGGREGASYGGAAPIRPGEGGREGASYRSTPGREPLAPPLTRSCPRRRTQVSVLQMGKRRASLSDESANGLSSTWSGVMLPFLPQQQRITEHFERMSILKRHRVCARDLVFREGATCGPRMDEVGRREGRRAGSSRPAGITGLTSILISEAIFRRVNDRPWNPLCSGGDLVWEPGPE